MRPPTLDNRDMALILEYDADYAKYGSARCPRFREFARSRPETLCRVHDKVASQEKKP